MPSPPGATLALSWSVCLSAPPRSHPGRCGVDGCWCARLAEKESEARGVEGHGWPWQRLSPKARLFSAAVNCHPDGLILFLKRQALKGLEGSDPLTGGIHFLCFQPLPTVSEPGN